MNSMCRLCLSDDGFMEPIISDQNTVLLDKIFDLTSIKIKNVARWPSGICEECKSKLIISVNFRKVCIETQNIILEEIGLEESDAEENDSDAVVLSNGKIDEEEVIEILDSSDDEKSNSSNDDKTYCYKRRSSRVTKTSRKNYYEGEDSSGERPPQRIRERRSSVKIINYSEEPDDASNNNNNNIISHLECEICHFICKSKILLEEHRLLHANKTCEKLLTCDVCNSSFRNKHKLKQHAICHTDKKYKCPHCKRTFRHERNLISHKTRVNCIYNDCSSTSLL